MIFADPTFNAINLLGLMVSLMTLPKLFSVIDIGCFSDHKGKVRWKDILIASILSIIPILNVTAGIIGSVFWIVWVIKNTPLLNIIKQALNKEVF